MNPSPFRSHCLSASARLYQVLLLVCSRDLRRQYGHEMGQVFRTACRLAAERDGVPGLAAIWRRALWDLLMTAMEERRSRIRSQVNLLGIVPFAIAMLIAYLAGSMHARTDADTMSGLILIGGAFFCGAVHPKGAWRWGAIIGLGIPLAFLIEHGLRPLDLASGDRDTIIALGLFPALIAAYLGVLGHRIATRLGAPLTLGH